MTQSVYIYTLCVHKQAVVMVRVRVRKCNVSHVMSSAAMETRLYAMCLCVCSTSHVSQQRTAE